MRHATIFFLIITALFWVAMSVGCGDLNPMHWHELIDMGFLGSLLSCWIILSIYAIYIGLDGSGELEKKV